MKINKSWYFLSIKINFYIILLKLIIFLPFFLAEIGFLTWIVDFSMFVVLGSRRNTCVRPSAKSIKKEVTRVINTVLQKNNSKKSISKYELRVLTWGEGRVFRSFGKQILNFDSVYKVTGNKLEAFEWIFRSWFMEVNFG